MRSFRKAYVLSMPDENMSSTSRAVRCPFDFALSYAEEHYLDYTFLITPETIQKFEKECSLDVPDQATY